MHAYIANEYVANLLNIDNIDQQLYEEYVDNGIDFNVRLWAPLKRCTYNTSVRWRRQDKISGKI